MRGGRSECDDGMRDDAMCEDGGTRGDAQVPVDEPQPTDWGKLYEQCHDKVKRYLARRVKSPHDVEDLLQDVFASLITRGGRLRRPEVYVYAAVKHRLSFYWRRKDADIELTVSFCRDEFSGRRPCCDYGSDPAGQLSKKEMRQAVISMVKRLPPASGEALRLRFIEGMPPRQAAACAGCSYEALKKRLAYARRFLVQLCQERGVTPSSTTASETGDANDRTMGL